jgi:type I restriction enzyme S subunit
MELKPGYKHTEIGVFPEDWAVSNLKTISALISKGSTPTTYGHNWVSDGVVFLRSECVTGNGLDLSQSMFISEGAHTMLRRSETCDGDLLMTITGNVGRVVRVMNIGRANLNQHIARIRVNKENVDSVYVLQYLSQPKVRRMFESITTGQAYPQISLRQVREAKLPLPKPAEQKAIADALSDVDSLIDSLEALIAKTCDIKTGTMQELLTGRTRLPGFTGEWSSIRLGDFAKIIMGQSPESRHYNLNGLGLPLIQGNGDIKDRRTIQRVWTVETTKKATLGDVILTVRAPVGAAAIASDDVCLGRGVCAVRPIAGKPSFLLHMLVFKEPYWRALEQGSTFTAANSRQIANFVIDAPRELEEQGSIGALISDMDLEIEALEKRLAKTRDLKQGMAQELLTGRTRLV